MLSQSCPSLFLLGKPLGQLVEPFVNGSLVRGDALLQLPVHVQGLLVVLNLLRLVPGQLLAQLRDLLIMAICPVSKTGDLVAVHLTQCRLPGRQRLQVTKAATVASVTLGVLPANLLVVLLAEDEIPLECGPGSCLHDLLLSLLDRTHAAHELRPSALEPGCANEVLEYPCCGALLILEEHLVEVLGVHAGISAIDSVLFMRHSPGSQAIATCPRHAVSPLRGEVVRDGSG
mmetsp:Transcript_420/g.1056  ORF Transcript_420/g.1056 Transcript_420/m.1056 type:complete len:231 (+) Transcript_420:850-1542(+)